MRVVAGQFRGRRLRAPAGMETRPTADRVRQALFAVLGEMDGLSVADLYAGSGALGIEALSRGARHAVFVESARGALRALRANLDSLGLAGRSTVLPLPVRAATRRVVTDGPYDLVLCDPPWPDLASATAALSCLVRLGILAEQGRLVLEHPKSQTVELAGGLVVTDTRYWGGTAVSIFQQAADEPFCPDSP